MGGKWRLFSRKGGNVSTRRKRSFSEQGTRTSELNMHVTFVVAIGDPFRWKTEGKIIIHKQISLISFVPLQ